MVSRRHVAISRGFQARSGGSRLTNGALPEIRYRMGLDGVLRVREEMLVRRIAGSETIFVPRVFRITMAYCTRN
jgi:hypothetical protein